MTDNETRMFFGMRPWNVKGMTIEEAREILLNSLGPALNPLNKDGRPIPDVRDETMPHSSAQAARGPRLRGTVANEESAEKVRSSWVDADTPGWCRAAGRANVEETMSWHRLYRDVTVSGAYDCMNKFEAIERVPGALRNRDWLIQDDDERRLEGERWVYPGGYKDIPPERPRSHTYQYEFDPMQSRVPELREWARRYRAR